MLEITCSKRAEAFLYVATTTFAATAVAQGTSGAITVRSTGQLETYSHTTNSADSAPSAWNAITARDIDEGEREVREGHWISLAELRRELRDQDR